MSKPNEKVTIPPYVPYQTFQNFLDGLKPVPPVIDGAVVKRFSGSLQSQLRSSLRYLKLTDEDGKTQPALRELAAAQDEERKKELKKLLNQAYSFLFKPDDAFSLSEGTSPQFYAKFEKQGASGDSLRKCGKFFLDAATDAGIVISPYIKSKGAAKTKSDTGKPAGKSKSKQKQKNNNGQGNDGKLFTPPLPSDLPKWFEPFKPAFDKLPNFDNPHWTKADRDAWINFVSALLDLYIKTDEKSGK